MMGGIVIWGDIYVNFDERMKSMPYFKACIRKRNSRILAIVQFSIISGI